MVGEVRYFNQGQSLDDACLSVLLLRWDASNGIINFLLKCWWQSVMCDCDRGKLSRLLRQFTPYVWTEFDWRPTSSLNRWFSMLIIIAMVSCTLWSHLLSLHIVNERVV